MTVPGPSVASTILPRQTSAPRRGRPDRVRRARRDRSDRVAATGGPPTPRRAPRPAPRSWLSLRGRGAPPTWARLLVLLGLALLWWESLRSVPTDRLDQWGLLTAVGAPFYVAAVGILLVLVLELTAERVRPLSAGAALGGLLALMYATPALVEAVPRLPWVYKHLAVTEYFQTALRVVVDRDIYQRWPAFFTGTATLGDLTGTADPISYAAWAELGFALVDAALVLAVARVISSDSRWAWTAATLYTMVNWVGQNYFAPQALAYTLSLAQVLILLTVLGAAPNRLGRRVQRLVGRVLRSGETVDVDPGPVQAVTETRASRRAAAAAHRRVTAGAVLVVVLHIVITTTHQLTPYIVLLTVVPLFLVGRLRPWWLPVVLVVVPLAYLWPNLDYIQEHYGLFSADPLANASYTAVDRSALPLATVVQGRALLALTGLAYLLALIGLLRRVRRGGIASALVVGWLMVAPGATLLGQSYGGEGRYRILLFSSAWAAMAAAWAFRPGGTPRTPRTPLAPRPLRTPRAARTRFVTGGAVLLLGATALAAQLQSEATNHVAAEDVATAHWLQDTATSRDVVLLWGTDFPLSSSGVDAEIGRVASLADSKQWFPTGLSAEDVSAIAYGEELQPEHVFVVFSPTMSAGCANSCGYAAGEQAGLEASLLAAGYTLVHTDGGARVYEG